MKTEKVILSFVATILGLLVAGGLFFFFQFSKSNNDNPKNIAVLITLTPTPIPSITLELNQPEDEKVYDNKTLIVSGKTRADAIVAILVNGFENIVKPSLSGNFSKSVTLSDGQNIIEVIAVAQDGETKSIIQTVTYSTEDF